MNVSGTGPLKLTGSADAPLQNLKLFGKSVQNGTPSPDNPVAIENIGKVVSNSDRTIGVTVSKDGDSTQSQTLDISIPVYRKNLCSTNNLVFETSEQIKFAENIPAGDYILSASIKSTDTDSTANLALFYCTDGSTKEVYLTRNAGARVSKAFNSSIV